MMILKRILLLALVLVTLLAVLLLAMKDKITLGAEAYLYGYPLVIMELRAFKARNTSVLKISCAWSGNFQTRNLKMWCGPMSIRFTPQHLSA